MKKYTLKITTDSSANMLAYSGNYRFFAAPDGLDDAVRVLAISDDVDMGSGDPACLLRSFRYSTDRSSWSMWYDFNDQAGIDEISQISYAEGARVYVEYKYEYDDGTYDALVTPVTVNSISASFELRSVSAPLESGDTIAADGTPEFCPTVVFERNTVFDPYDVDNFVRLYAETSLYVNRTFGLPVLYFRTLPRNGGGDYIFKEWNILDVVEKKCIRVVVPNNDFPDSKLHYAEFGIDYDAPFEVHIDRLYFESMFGTGTDVRKKDFLYFPLLNRMYEVQGCYMHRGLMMQPIFWKVQLVKFAPNINYVMRAEDTVFLDNLLLDSEETLATVANGDISDAVMPDQYKTLSERFEEARASLDADTVVRQERFYYDYAPLIDYYYDFTTGISAGSSPVVYKRRAVFGEQMPNVTYCALVNMRLAGSNATVIESWTPGSPSPGTGMRISCMLNGTSLTVTASANSNEYTAVANGASLYHWYAIVVQMSYEFAQVGIFVYSFAEDAGDSLNHVGLRKICGKTMALLPGSDFQTGVGYSLKQGKIYVSNLRVFKTLVKLEDHSNMISQLFVQDESMLHLVDNCRPQLNAPIVAKAR